MGKTLVSVPAWRIMSEEGEREEDCLVVVEAIVSLAIEGGGQYSLLALPTQLRELAAGFLLAENLIGSAHDILAIEAAPETPTTLLIRVRDPQRAGRGTRNLMGVSACGLCGSEALGRLLARLPPVADRLRTTADSLHDMAADLHRAQELFPRTGGTHAALLADLSGQRLAFAEDVGRHNALDKAIGACLLEPRWRQVPADALAMLSGRVSVELIVKCARAGIELAAAVSAPTAAAVETAERCGITLCGFVRPGRLTVFTHRHRVLA